MLYPLAGNASSNPSLFIQEFTMHYHFRDILGTKFLNNQHTPMECYEGFEAALALAYAMSAENDKAVYVCRDSGTVDQPAYTEVASVRACK